MVRDGNAPVSQEEVDDNPDPTKAQIEELQKALPNCKIKHNAK